jgi:hypothetical protein
MVDPSKMVPTDGLRSLRYDDARWKCAMDIVVVHDREPNLLEIVFAL